jgi:hypothetical protein
VQPVPAPWTLALEGLVWLQGIGVGGFARYADSPVGPYSEVWCSPLLSPALHIPFMAVDSEVSMRAGRANWALPKEMAAFDGWSAQGDGWSVAARVRTAGPRLPFAAAGQLRQRAADGTPVRSLARAVGLWRPARVEVAAEGVPCLRGGRRAGFLIERARLTVGLASTG